MSKVNKRLVGAPRRVAVCLLAAAGGMGLVGCDQQAKNVGSTLDFNKGFLDPTAVGRFQKQPLVVPILESLDRAVDVPDDAFKSATDVTAEDLNPATNDYLIGKNDLVSISITDLVAPNVETVNTKRVSEGGMISLPLIGQVKAAGLTEAQLEKEISKAYRQAQIIQNAQVSVSVSEARARTFSIRGAVAAPGQYAILNSEFRVLDALVLARDVSVQGVTDIYVIRQVDQNKAPATQEKPDQPSGPSDDVLTPKSDAGTASPVILAQAAPTTKAVSGNVTSDDQKFITVDGKQIAVTPATNKAPTAGAPAAPAKPTVMPVAEAATAPAKAAGAFQFKDPVAEGKTRVIRIPYEQLNNGDLRYNIVIKPYDMIVVAQPTVGEFYVGGHVARVGVYSLTGRKITLKNAIVSAGMFDQLAIPPQTDVVRRIGGDREITVTVDLDKVFDGSQPDIFLKPYDVINVGTTWWAPFVAAVRGGFRMTYGFGFLYDRNWAPAQTQTVSTGG